MANVQSGLSKLPCKQKNQNYKELVEDLLNGYQTMVCNVSMKIHFLHSHLISSLCTWAQWVTNMEKVPLGYFHHAEKICSKVIIEHVSWLLLEPCWRDVYCQFQTNELQKEVLNMSKIIYLFSYFCCVMAWNYFHTGFLPLFFNSLRSFQHEKVFLNQRTHLHNSSKILVK